MVYAQPRIHPGKLVAQTPSGVLRYKRMTKSRSDDQTLLYSIKKENLSNYPVGAQSKIKISEKKGKYLDLTREMKKLWNMNVTIIPIVIGALGTVTKGLVQGLEDLEIRERVEKIQTTTLRP